MMAYNYIKVLMNAGRKPRLRDYLLGDTCGGTVGDDVNG